MSWDDLYQFCDAICWQGLAITGILSDFALTAIFAHHRLPELRLQPVAAQESRDGQCLHGWFEAFGDTKADCKTNLETEEGVLPRTGGLRPNRAVSLRSRGLSLPEDG